MTRQMKLQNASGTKFDLAVTRDVRLLDETELADLFGDAARLISSNDTKLVAYETVNSIRNDGPTMTSKGGLVSIWILGMLNAGPETVIVVPYRAGDESELGPAVKSDYFGQVPADRLKVPSRSDPVPGRRRVSAPRSAPPNIVLKTYSARSTSPPAS